MFQVDKIDPKITPNFDPKKGSKNRLGVRPNNALFRNPLPPKNALRVQNFGPPLPLLFWRVWQFPPCQDGQKCNFLLPVSTSSAKNGKNRAKIDLKISILKNREKWPFLAFWPDFGPKSVPVFDPIFDPIFDPKNDPKIVVQGPSEVMFFGPDPSPKTTFPRRPIFSLKSRFWLKRHGQSYH